MVELARLIDQELRDSQAFRTEVLGLVEELQKSLPPELRDLLPQAENSLRDDEVADDSAADEHLSDLIRAGTGDVLARLEGLGEAE